MSYQSRDPLIGHDDFLMTPVTPRRALAARVAATLALWRERSEMRRHLAQMDARSLRDAGISPAAAAYESGQPFWRKMGGLR